MKRPCFSLGVLLSSLAVCLFAVGSANSQTGLDAHAPCLMCPYGGSTYANAPLSGPMIADQTEDDVAVAELPTTEATEATPEDVTSVDSNVEVVDADDDLDYRDAGEYDDYDYTEYDDYDYTDYDYDYTEYDDSERDSTSDETTAPTSDDDVAEYDDTEYENDYTDYEYDASDDNYDDSDYNYDDSDYSYDDSAIDADAATADSDDSDDYDGSEYNYDGSDYQYDGSDYNYDGTDYEYDYSDYADDDATDDATDADATDATDAAATDADVPADADADATDENESDYDYADYDYTDYEDTDYERLYGEADTEATAPVVEAPMNDSTPVEADTYEDYDAYEDYDNYDYEDYFAEVYSNEEEVNEAADTPTVEPATEDVEPAVEDVEPATEDVEPAVEVADNATIEPATAETDAPVVVNEDADAFDYFDADAFEPEANDQEPVLDDADLNDAYKSDYELIEMIDEVQAEDDTTPTIDAIEVEAANAPIATDALEGAEDLGAEIYNLRTTYDDSYDEVMAPTIETPTVETPAVESHDFNGNDHCFGGYASEYRCDLADAYQDEAYQSFYHDGSDPSMSEIEAEVAIEPSLPTVVEPYIAILMDRVGSTWQAFSMNAIVDTAMNELAKVPEALTGGDIEPSQESSIADYIDCKNDAGSCEPSPFEIDCFGAWGSTQAVGSGVKKVEDSAVELTDPAAEAIDTAALDAAKATICELPSRLNAPRQSPPLR